MTAIIISVVLIIVSVILDQGSKYAIVALFDLGDHILEGYDVVYGISQRLPSIDVIPGVLQLSFVPNDGAAFGMFDDSRWIFLTLSTAAIIGILVFMFWKKPQDKLLLSSLILIVSGGIGNMIDRIALGYVIDFIDFCAFPKIWKWVFNVADSFVCIGAGLLILWLVLDMSKEYKAEKARTAVPSASEDKENDE